MREDPTILPEESLDTNVDDLLGLNGHGGVNPEVQASESPPPKPGEGRTRRDAAPRTAWAAAASTLALVVIAGVLARALPVEPFVNGDTVGAHTWRFVRWKQSTPDEISQHAVLTWENRQVIVYGLSGAGIDAGRIYARDLRTGHLLWTRDPDAVRLTRVFGDDYLQAGGFDCDGMTTSDVNGDGEREIVATFRHDAWYPAYVEVLSRDGTPVGSYHSFGLMYKVHAEDLDGDGRDEILVAATNNRPAYQGASVILLDADHLEGAAVDSLSQAATPGFRDGSLSRVVLPQFDAEYMNRLSWDRLTAVDLRVFRTPKGDVRVQVHVGDGRATAVVTLSAQLEPVHVAPSDALKRRTLEWPADVSRRFLSREYLEGEWMPRRYLYGAIWDAAGLESRERHGTAVQGLAGS